MRYILSAAIVMALSLSVHAQSKLAGNWEGKIEAGGKTMHLVLRVKEVNGKLIATFDSPDQHATGMAVSSISLNNDTVSFSLDQPPVKYIGMMLDPNSFTGIWQQNGGSMPIDFNKTDKPTELSRPQTPRPPYIYKTEDVTFGNADKSISYGGTITIPNTPGAKPALLLVTGSGPQNRDEELMGHKPFAVLADYLTNKGYIVLRVDDRGVGETTGDRTNATTADFVKDANAAIDYLKTRAEVNQKKIGILGHSEGGMIAPAVAANRKDIDFIILLAGPGQKIYELMEDQSAANMLAIGANADVVKSYRTLYRGMEQSVIAASSEADAKMRMGKVLDAWKAVASKEAKEIVGVANNEKGTEVIDEFMYMYKDDWFNHFVKYDPQPVLKSLSCKVLALNGSKDIQVVAAGNIAGLNESLSKSKTKNYEVKELPGLNHLFQECSKCTVKEYGELEQTISPVALETIKDWLDKKVK